MTQAPIVEEATFVTGAYRVLSVEGPWEPAYGALFEQRECSALRWGWRRRRPLERVSDLALLRPLRAMSLHVGVGDDRALERLVELEYLDSTTGSQVGLDLSGLTKLRSLALDDRPALQLPSSVHGLSLACSGRTSLDILSTCAANLNSFKLEAERQAQLLDLTTTPALSSLSRLTVDGAHAELTATRLRLPALQYLQLLGPSRGSVTGRIDLSLLADSVHLRKITIRGAAEVLNAEALDALPVLERVLVVGKETVVRGDGKRLTRAA